MYYRRKVLLSLLEAFDGKLEKIRFQKLLMLFSKLQEVAAFHFVPHKYGCFSFQANADMNTMVKYSQVTNTQKEWIKADKISYAFKLREKDKVALSNLKRIYGKKSTDELIELTYERYPYYAINSTILEKVLVGEKLERVNNAKKQFNQTTLFTIGYEGITLEQYLNKLIENDIKVLVDVRSNALSMKYGFSKNQLKNSCDAVGIKYWHFPEVGIESDKRRELKDQRDYDSLFQTYKKENLKNTKKVQSEILNIVLQKKRVALTCFEANICQCHRKLLAESISGLHGVHVPIKHI